MSVFDSNPRVPENIGMALLRRASLEDDAMVDGCCPTCHSTDIEKECTGAPGYWCNECAAYFLNNSPLVFPGSTEPRVTTASHLNDALKSFDHPEREVNRRELSALVDHAAFLHMQVRELTETLRAERDRMRRAA